MGCGFSRELLTAYFDGEVDASERAQTERHITSCSDCLRELADMKSLSMRVRRLERRPAPVSLAEPIAREIRLIAAIRFTRAGRWAQWAVSMAAVVLVSASVAVVVRRHAASRESAGVPVAVEAPGRSDPGTSEGVQPWVTAPGFDRMYTPFDGWLLDGRERNDVEGGESESEREETPLDSSGFPTRPPADFEAAADKSESLEVWIVTSDDGRGMRAKIEDRLKRRGLPFVKGSPTLVGSDYVRSRYLEVELPEDELRLLREEILHEAAALEQSTSEAEAKWLRERGERATADEKKLDGTPLPESARRASGRRIILAFR
ncbi:MAG: zf-HC2 domain-containing protein [Planctomycetes bacterium]|nr:zf-HC2 domain-containing protein [Planctomycetota bacterium]